MYICVYIYTHTYIYRSYMYVCIHIYADTYIQKHIYTHRSCTNRRRKRAHTHNGTRANVTQQTKGCYRGRKPVSKKLLVRYRRVTSQQGATPMAQDWLIHIGDVRLDSFIYEIEKSWMCVAHSRLLYLLYEWVMSDINDSCLVRTSHSHVTYARVTSQQGATPMAQDM